MYVNINFIFPYSLNIRIMIPSIYLLCHDILILKITHILMQIFIIRWINELK